MANTSIRLVAIQTMTPSRITEPGRSRRLSLAGPLRPDTLQTHLRVVLYYRRAGEEESARTVAALIKASFSAALPEQPLLAGRLRRDGEAEGYWEVKFNDAGVRLVQATAETTMEEFLGSKDRDASEAQLAYWQDIDGVNPNFSALFYIQVTEFQGDGYSIGISCSLLLADPVFLTQFLKKWALLHGLLVAQGQLSEASIFHLDYFQRPGQPSRIKPTSLDSTTTTSNTTTMLFKIPRAPADRAAGYDALASRCLKETSQMLERREVSEFTLLVSDHSGDLKECCAKDGLLRPDRVFDGALDIACWDDCGLEEMTLSEGNKPIHVSYRVVSSADQGLVVVMLPSSDGEGASGLLISVTIPTKI